MEKVLATWGLASAVTFHTGCGRSRSSLSRSSVVPARRSKLAYRREELVRRRLARSQPTVASCFTPLSNSMRALPAPSEYQRLLPLLSQEQIGRASCRERESVE